jgi:ABC-type transporter Mla MlaB component
MQLVLELLTQKTDGQAIVLQNIGAGVDALINLYELLHIVHMQVGGN